MLIFSLHNLCYFQGSTPTTKSSWPLQPSQAQTFLPTKPVLFTSKPSQPVIESKTISQPSPLFKNIQQTAIGKPQPLFNIPKAEIKPTPAATVTPSTPTVSATVSAPTATSTQPVVVSSDTQKLIQKMIQEECAMLEAELKALLHKAHAVNVNLGTDKEGTGLARSIDDLECFLNDVMEISTGQAAEVNFDRK